MYEDPKEMAGVMKNCFQSVYTKESVEMINGVQKFQVSVNEVRKIMEE